MRRMEASIIAFVVLTVSLTLGLMGAGEVYSTAITESPQVAAKGTDYEGLVQDQESLYTCPACDNSASWFVMGNIRSFN